MSVLNYLKYILEKELGFTFWKPSNGIWEEIRMSHYMLWRRRVKRTSGMITISVVKLL